LPPCLSQLAKRKSHPAQKQTYMAAQFAFAKGKPGKRIGEINAGFPRQRVVWVSAYPN